eukprot:GFKZ01004481.1.p1 GENE.GFKZ01004481.1~~GFKZ01004481.1.p1  ORF type:complete len:663 (+),score=93.40 GFKZ01004481.1:50-1990(+)
MAFLPSTFTPSFDVSRPHLAPVSPPSSTSRPTRPYSFPCAVLQHPKPKPKPKQKRKFLPGQPGHRFHEYSPQQIEAVRIRHCLLDTADLAKHVLSQIVSRKATLADLAKSLSTCPASKASGGDLGWWWNDETLPQDVSQFGINDRLLGAALRTRPNKVDLVQTDLGWHVYVVEEARHILSTKHERTPWRANPNRNKVDHDVPEPLHRSYAMQTLGCQMNRSDSERMAGELERLGYSPIDDPFRASVLVLNTCNIRERAESKVYSYIGRHVERKRKFPHQVTLAVAGCVAQQEGEKMLRRIPELDLVFGPQYANRLGDLLQDVERNQCQVAATDPLHVTEDISTPRRESTVTAWVNVMYGCGENCTFCTVGNVVRTVEQSRTMDAIRREVEQIADAGIREVVLLGQNIDAYGRDMHPKGKFSDLLRFVHDVDGIDRIRFTTSHPRYITQNLVDVCAELPKIMPFFHIPPQSGSNKVLKEMRRGYGVDKYKLVVKRIREAIPDAAICGDMIVGFPGETEEEFQESLKLMEDIKFDVMNTAAYSRRPNTPAAEMENQVPEAVKSDRLARMNEVVGRHAEERSQRYVGRVEHVLVEGLNARDSNQVVGRNPNNRPVIFEGSSDLKGKIVAVKVTQAFPFSLKGIQVGEPY